MSSTIIHTRMKAQLKKEVEKVLSQLGLTMSEAIRLYFAQIAHKKAIPFSIDLELDDKKENYIRVENVNDLKTLMNLD